MWNGSFGQQHRSAALPAPYTNLTRLTTPLAQNTDWQPSQHEACVFDVPQLVPLLYPTRLLKNKHHEGVSTSEMLPTDRLSPSTTAPSQVSSVLGRRDHIIDLEDHLHHLRGKQDLLLLANQSLKDVLLLHVVGANVIAVYAAVGVALLQRCSVIAYHYGFQIIIYISRTINSKNTI